MARVSPQAAQRVVAALLTTAWMLVAVGSAGAATLDVNTGSPPHYAGWKGPISLTITLGADDPPDATFSMAWDNDASSIQPAGGSGPCASQTGQTTLQCELTQGAAVGTHTLKVRSDDTGGTVNSVTVTVVAHLNQRVVSAGPSPFYPYRHDGFRDQVNLVYVISKNASTWFQVKNTQGTIVRHSPHRFFMAGRHTMHWGGDNDSGRLVRANHYYWIRLLTSAGGESRIGDWHRVYARRVG
ncbi:MAG: hypothetical protein ACHQEA_07145 [Gaiellales bacterium]